MSIYDLCTVGCTADSLCHDCKILGNYRYHIRASQGSPTTIPRHEDDTDGIILMKLAKFCETRWRSVKIVGEDGSQVTAIQLQ